MKRITISLPDEIGVTVEREARRRGCSVSSVMRKAVVTYLKIPEEGQVRDIPFANLGRSTNNTGTARNMEELMAREWTDVRDS